MADWKKPTGAFQSSYSILLLESRPNYYVLCTFWISIQSPPLTSGTLPCVGFKPVVQLTIGETKETHTMVQEATNNSEENSL